MALAVTDTCLHCGSALENSRDGYCCIGCRFVAKLLREEGLEKYYSLRGPTGEAVTTTDNRDRKWLEPLEEHVREADGIARVDLDVQGLSCAACVWLIEQLFRREEGAFRVVVNPALGTMTMSVAALFNLRRFVERIESCGYLLGPTRKTEKSDRGLLLRMGLCIAFAMNGMVVAVALYAGAETSALGPFFRAMTFAFSCMSVLVGGSWFFRSAFHALRRGVLHLDLPIALGIALAFTSSAWAYLDHDALGYFDPLNVFIALMLVGRYLQQRVLEQNRRRLLADDGVEALLSRRLENGRPALIRCSQIERGDRLLLAPGDVVPVECTLDAPATFSLDWINGESAPRAFHDAVPAGAFLAGDETRTLTARQSFADSALIDLLRTPARSGDDVSTFWQRFAQLWTVGVLLLAAGAFFVGMRVSDPRAALDRVTAVLIVTCPCAFGIAAPLAYQIVQARLRKAGLFVRTTSFLDRAADLRRIVFDKTGTLTTGRLVAVADFDSLSEDARVALVNLANRSMHPKSAAIARAVGQKGFDESLVVAEHVGQGISLHYKGRHYALDKRGFTADHQLLLPIETIEDLRADAAREVQALRDAGYEVGILSGDAEARVATVAAAVGIREFRGDQSPSDKAAYIHAVDRNDTLVVGDGINDGPAIATAFCSGTPAVDRPFIAARSDFYLVSAGLAPIRLALEAARRLARVLRISLGVALAYNAVTIALAYTGVMTPLLCAVLMPASSLSSIVAVIASLHGESWHRVKALEPWTSSTSRSS
jgi:P-type Cu2+ transporter